MVKEAIMPADSYIIINKTILNDRDHIVLSMLYQPIVGSTAISLYLTLWAYLDKNEVTSRQWTHHHLMRNMQISLEEILLAREKLEAIGLIKTYIKKGSINSYIYELYSPISANDFINNPVLNVTLYNNVGKIEFEKIVEYFKTPKISVKDYEDITVSFNDVFVSNPGITINYTDDLKTTSYNELKITSKIDLNNILSLIPEELLNIRIVTKDTKDLLYKLAFIYDLDDDMMQEVIRQSLTLKRTIDKDKLRITARKYYQFENNGKLPSLVFRNQPLYLRKPIGENSIKAKAIYQFETTTPYDFLASKNKGNPPTKSDLKIIEYLLVDLNMKPGVVNALVDYVLKINNNKLTRSYVEVIASQWVRSKVETVEEAILLAEKEYKRTNRNNPKKTEIKPSWFNENIKKEEVSEEELAQLKDMFKDFK